MAMEFAVSTGRSCFSLLALKRLFAAFELSSIVLCLEFTQLFLRKSQAQNKNK